MRVPPFKHSIKGIHLVQKKKKKSYAYAFCGLRSTFVICIYFFPFMLRHVNVCMYFKKKKKIAMYTDRTRNPWATQASHHTESWSPTLVRAEECSSRNIHYLSGTSWCKKKKKMDAWFGDKFLFIFLECPIPLCVLSFLVTSLFYWSRARACVCVCVHVYIFF